MDALVIPYVFVEDEFSIVPFRLEGCFGFEKHIQ